MSECNQTSETLATPPTEQEKAVAASSILKALGVGPCKTTSTAGVIVSLTPPAAGAAGVSTSVNCEQISVLIDSVVAVQRNLNCTLREIVDTTGVFIDEKQTMDVQIRGLMARYINLKQVIDDKVKIFRTLNVQDKIAISNNLTQFNTDFFKSLMSSKTGYLSTPQGQKAVTDSSGTFSEDNVNKVISKTLSTLQADIKTDQLMRVVIDGYDPVSVGAGKGDLQAINLTQETYIDLATSQILNNFFDELFSTTEGQKLKKDIETGIVNESKGAESIIPNLFGGAILLLALIAFGVFFFGGTAAKFVIPLGLIAAAAGTLLFALHKPPKVLYSIVSGIIALILGVLEALSLKRSGK